MGIPVPTTAMDLIHVVYTTVLLCPVFLFAMEGDLKGSALLKLCPKALQPQRDAPGQAVYTVIVSGPRATTASLAQ